MNGFQAIVLLVYGSLALAWGYIIVFSWRNMVSELARNTLLLLLFTILMLDAARSVVESGYFGMMLASQFGVLPGYLSEILSRPALLLIPKLISLVSVLLIIFLVLKRWLPAKADVLLKEQRQSQEQIRLNRGLEELYRSDRYLLGMTRLSSEINQVLLSSVSLEDILHKSCDRITRHEGYTLAWIGLVDEAGDELRVGYSSDYCDPPYLDATFRVSLVADQSSLGPAGRCILENREVVIEDTQTDPDFSPWRERARLSGIKSVVGFPLKALEQAEPYGCLMIYTEHDSGFSTQEIKALQEIADTIARAVHLRNVTDQRYQAEEAVRDSEQRLQYVIEGADLGFWDWDYASGRQEVSDRWLEILGLSREDIHNDVTDWDSRIHPDDWLEVEAIIQKAIEEDRPYRVEYRIRHNSGDWIWIEGSGAVVEWDNKGIEPVRLCGTHQDITRRKKAEMYLRESERRFKELIGSLPNIAVQGYDRDRRVIYWNKSSEKLYGYTAEEVVGSKLEDLIIPDEMREPVIQGVSAWIEQGIEIPSGELELRRKDGSPVPVFSSHIMLKLDLDEPEMFCIDVDLTKQKRAQAELEHMASYDPLTHLPNRYLLNRELDKRIHEAERFDQKLAILFIDLDNFKLVNDSLGHQYGDLLLQKVVKRISGHLREYDVLARFGGDEFVLLMPRVAKGDEVIPVAEKLIQSFSKPFDLDGHEAFTAVSIGISLFPGDGKEGAELLKHADAAMYRAKESGRNCYRFFTQAMNARMQHHRAVETRLRQSLNKDHFVLHYQPQLDLNSGEIIGCEALIRWRPPGAGLLLPGEFIPVAEKSELISRISEWVLDEACRQKAEWKAMGLKDIPLDINLSGRQFSSHAVFDLFNDALDRHGLKSSDIGIELTEQVLIQSDDTTLTWLQQLREQGTNISIDDFGTGYSSLSYLKRFPVNRLKIDREFIRDAVSDSDDRSIIKAIVAMGHSLGLMVVVEGVERDDQRRLALELGCDIGQGYFFHRPMEAKALVKLLS